MKLKLNANQTTIKNKKIILIDDSLVRGTTSHKIVKMLYDAGAKEVHVKIACPEIKYPDFYGVDTPTKKELLAANKTNNEICEYIGAKSLKFLSLDGMYKAIGFDKRMIIILNLQIIILLEIILLNLLMNLGITKLLSYLCLVQRQIIS